MADQPLHDADPSDLTDAVRAVSVPPQIETPLGTFDLVDGVPTADSVDRLYDSLDFVRGIDAFLNCMPGASLVAMRRGLRSVGLDSPQVVGYTDPRANSGSIFLTPNTETTYGTLFIDLKANGPTVIEPPEQSLCVVDDFWFRYIADMGVAGPDRGAGGRYLFLPPGYDGSEPDGYYTYRSPTYTIWVVLRALGGVEALRQTRIYPFAQADDPPETAFANLAELHFNTVHANDFSYYEEIDELVQEEPPGSLDPERAGQLAGIGIVHGKPFEPTERRRATLDSAARTAAAISRALVYAPRDPEATIFDGSSWWQAFIGGSYEFLRDSARLLDARTAFHYFATVITPAMAHAQVGAGSAYAYTTLDANGDILDGGRDYTLTLPPDPPAANFWSIDIYDTQTRSLLQTDNPYPSVMSLGDGVTPNDDGSFTIRFGPSVAVGERNAIQTVAGKGWFPIIRLYGPLQPWFDKTWQPGEIQPAP
jgi:hypothetical protein